MCDMRPMELRDTVDMMNSEDYKERFKAEYYQTVEQFLVSQIQTLDFFWT